MNNDITSLQSSVAALDFTQTSDVVVPQIRNLLQEIIATYVSDQMSNPTSDGLDSISSVIGTMKQSLSVQVANPAQPAPAINSTP